MAGKVKYEGGESIIDPLDSTSAFYEESALAYFDSTVGADVEKIRDDFLKEIPPGGKILDVGCGSGRDLKAFQERGFQAIGIDSSFNLSKIASNYSGAACLTMRIEDSKFDKCFDGVWALASLLHIEKEKMDSSLRAIRNALLPSGKFFASVKLGKGVLMAEDGRKFYLYELEEFRDIVTSSGFEVERAWISKDQLPGRTDIGWANILARLSTA